MQSDPCQLGDWSRARQHSSAIDESMTDIPSILAAHRLADIVGAGGGGGNHSNECNEDGGNLKTSEHDEENVLDV